MLKSMTGYGEATMEGENFSLTIEVKSVNNRFLKITTKIPEEIAYLTGDLEELVRRSLSRGSVYMTVRFIPTRRQDLYEIDRGVLEKYLKTLRELRASLGTEEEILIKDLLLLPGVIHSEEALSLGKEAVLPVAQAALEQALHRVVAMRAEEGRGLHAELTARSQRLGELLLRVRAEVTQGLVEHRKRLEERVNVLLSGTSLRVAPDDLLKEVAIIAERSDIAEEVQRFESHLRQFDQTISGTEPAGRKLEFIVQEILRESNTMGAKSACSGLNEAVVEIKAEVDRLKEQVVNVE